jgi:hypothetical protein
VKVAELHPPAPEVGNANGSSMTSSVSESLGRSLPPAIRACVRVLSWADDRPAITAIVRCGPVVRGPDVAQMWPQRSRAWKARPGSPSNGETTSIGEVRAVCDQPLLSVRDRQMPVLRARGGHGRKDEPGSGVIVIVSSSTEG